MNKIMKGFTLVEIMIVVAIIAILAAVAIPNFVRYRKTSQMNACISNLKQLQGAVEQAKMTGVVTPAMSNIVGADKYIKVEPKCPSDQSTYTLPSTDDADPTCTHGEDSDYPHKLPTSSTTTESGS